MRDTMAEGLEIKVTGLIFEYFYQSSEIIFNGTLC